MFQLLADASLNQTILPPSTNIPEAYAHGSSEEQVSLVFSWKND